MPRVVSQDKSILQGHVMTFIVIGQVVHRRKLDFVGTKAHSLMLQLTMNNFLSVLNIRITPLGKFVEEVVHYCSKKD